ncbi:hypothetical protein V1511DRAFT_501887 [Dipodascopsis uninucleata]
MKSPIPESLNGVGSGTGVMGAHRLVGQADLSLPPINAPRVLNGFTGPYGYPAPVAYDYGGSHMGSMTNRGIPERAYPLLITEERRPVRKRRRIPVSCLVCRQRKLKCDKRSPCSACVTHGTVPMCTYAQRSWVDMQDSTSQSAQANDDADEHSSDGAFSKAPETDRVIIRQFDTNTRSLSDSDRSNDTIRELKEQMTRMEAILNKLANSRSQQDSERHEIHSVKLNTSKASTSNYLSSQTVLPADPMDTMTLRPELSLKKSRMTFFGPLSSIAAISEDGYIRKCLGQVHQAKKVLARRTDSERARGGLVSAAAALKTRSSHDVMPPSRIPNVSDETMKLMKVMFDPTTDPAMQFPRLEHKPVCDFLIDRYMKTINLIFPIVDPSVFRCDMTKFWNTKREATNNPNRQVNTEDRDDKFSLAAHKATLRGTALFVVLLRMGRLSLLHEWKPSDSGFDDKYAAFFGPRLHAYAWSCLRESNYLAKANLVVVQVLVGLRISQLISREDGDGTDSSDSAPLVGMISQIAITLGLHRDPSIFPQVPSSMADAWRKLWSQIVILDTYRSLELALPFSIPLEMTDTVLDSSYSFSDDVAQHEQPSQQFHSAHIKWAMLARSVLSRIMRPNYALERSELLQLIDQLEQFEEHHLGSFQSLISVIKVDEQISSPQDAYDLIQKYMLQLLVQRLQLQLLRSYSPATPADAELFRRDRLRCALKMLDTISTCMEHLKLFSDFEWILRPFAIHHYLYPLSLVLNGLIREYYENPKIIIPNFPLHAPLGQSSDAMDEDDRWLYPDLSFSYDDDGVRNLHRLYQAFVKTKKWIITLSNTYYSGSKDTSTMKVFSGYLKHEICNAKTASPREGDSGNISSVSSVIASSPASASIQTPASSSSDIVSVLNPVSVQENKGNNLTLELMQRRAAGSAYIPSEELDIASNATTSNSESIYEAIDWANPLDVLVTEDLVGESWHDWSFSLQDDIDFEDSSF